MLSGIFSIIRKFISRMHTVVDVSYRTPTRSRINTLGQRLSTGIVIEKQFSQAESKKDRYLEAMLSILRFRRRSGRRGKFYRLLRSIGLGSLVALLILFVVVPVTYRYSPYLQRYFIFLNSVGGNLDFSKPEDVGIPGTRNFYIESEENVLIGVWHILPESLIHSIPEMRFEEKEKWFEGTLRYNQPVILYLHGNKGSRGQSRRVEVYNLLRRMGYHIFSFDYRGFGDSSSVHPNETGLVTDAKAVFKYILKQTKASLIFVWGHSLGTGVTCHAAAQLCKEEVCPGGVILEAPFNNIPDEVRLNPLSLLFRWLPYFDWAFVDPLREIDVQFQSDVHIAQVTSPILILHAEDDNVVPFDLGKKLQVAGQKDRSSDLLPIKFIAFSAKYGYSHNHIAKAPELPSMISDFIKEAQESTAVKRIIRL